MHTSLTSTFKLGALECTRLTNQNNQVDISSFGGQLLRWSNRGKAVLFDNPAIINDQSKALRGGAPICFPWFNKGASWNRGSDLSPSHGPVRIKNWKTISSSSSLASYETEANSALGKPLKINVSYSLGDDSLSVDFEVSNLDCEAANPMELAIHSYFATSRPDTVRIIGLSDYPEGFNPKPPLDKILQNQGSELTAEFDDRRLRIQNRGFNKSVIWNPGKEHSLSDLPKSDKDPEFLCLESLSEIVEIPAVGKWKGGVIYSVSFV